MASREDMLKRIRQNQPEQCALPEIEQFKKEEADPVQKFATVLESIGGRAFRVQDAAEIPALITTHFPGIGRIVSTSQHLSGLETVGGEEDPHTLEDVDLGIVDPQLGVAENAAVYIPESRSKVRALPFICQYLAFVIRASDIVSTMHHAYERLGITQEGFGSFIAGPSKTADIEQALVLGAHGPKTMTAFIIG